MLLTVRLLCEHVMYEEYKEATWTPSGNCTHCEDESPHAGCHSPHRKWKAVVRNGEYPTLRPHTTRRVLSRWGLSLSLGRYCWREGGCSGGGRRGSRGRRSDAVEDQLEVSEWTLPGPSVGEVTDEGVGASCQPPFAWEGRGGTKRRGGGVTMTGKSWRHGSAAWDAGILFWVGRKSYT